MSKLIAEVKEPKFLIDTNNNSCIIDNEGICLSDEEVELLNKFYHITTERKAYSRAVYRNKIKEAFGFFNNTYLEVRSALNKSDSNLPHALFHCHFRNNDGNTNSLIHMLRFLVKKGNINYIKSYDSNEVIDITNIESFNNSFLESLMARPSINDEFKSLDEIIDSDMYVPLYVMVGFDTLRVIKELRLMNASPITILADYSRYKSTNYLIHQLNDEFTGIY